MAHFFISKQQVVVNLSKTNRRQDLQYRPQTSPLVQGMMPFVNAQQ